MVSAVSGASTLIPTSSAGSSPTANASPTPVADKDVNLLLQSNDVLQSLASRSSSYLPPTSAQVLSTLWALLNPNSSTSITESDVEKAIVSEGGKTSEADALWAQIDPNGASAIHAQDFAFNQYLTQAVSANLASLQTSVAQIQQQQGPVDSGSILGAFSALGGSSDVGSGIGIFINVFV
jgi:hypothetical protein